MSGLVAYIAGIGYWSKGLPSWADAVAYAREGAKVVGVSRTQANLDETLAAVKAVTAASLAIKGDGKHFVPLDAAIETMRQTGVDMNEKYKETSQGGLAVNVVEC